jgi:hypothetical protein
VTVKAPDYMKIVDDKKMALQIGAISNNQEDYGMYILYGLPQDPTSAEIYLLKLMQKS